MLGVSIADLRGLRHGKLPDDQSLSETLQYWMDTESSPVTWHTIIDVLRDDFINQPRVADKIQQNKLFTELYHNYQ